MISCSITARNFEADGKMRDYIEQKLGGLEKYVPRKVRGNVLCNVVLEDDPNGREDNRYVCEAVVNVSGDTLVSREGTVNMYAAVDIVEAKLKAQLVKFKEKRTFGRRRGQMLAQWLGRRRGVGPAVAEADAAGAAGADVPEAQSVSESDAAEQEAT